MKLVVNILIIFVRINLTKKNLIDLLELDLYMLESWYYYGTVGTRRREITEISIAYSLGLTSSEEPLYIITST